MALASTFGGARLLAEVQRLRAMPRVTDSGVVTKMQQYAKDTRWVYTRQTIYPFHAGLLVIPELAVLPSKRFWSGQITEEQIWATVKHSRPEQLLLSESEVASGVREFIESGYDPVYRDGALTLYVSKKLAAERDSEIERAP